MAGKRVTVLSGLPGSGKTHRRLTDETLANVPFFDIAAIYAEHNAKFPEFPMEWWMATEELIRQYREFLRHNDRCLVEGCFMPGSPSRGMLVKDAKVGGYELEFIDIKADPEVCAQRIQEQYAEGEIDWPTANSRLRILRNMTR